MRADLVGDKTLAVAYSNELKKRYGLKAGLKNYGAAYATGLLVARRLLASVNMADNYEAVEEVTGEINQTEDDEGKTHFVQEIDGEKRPFRANLDVGLAPTTHGARIWGALKGASDGGLAIPHNPKKFPGYNVEDKAYDASVHRDRIFGQHIAAYMTKLEEEDADAYKVMFADYIKAGVGADDIEGMYEAVHAAIRADPTAAPKSESAHDKTFKNRAKINLKQRKNRIKQKKLARWAALARQAADE